MKFWVLGALVVLTNAVAIAVQEGPPPVFDKRPYAEARRAATEGKKWFIVKATAEWCPPCKQMDKTTWRDAKVEGWLKQHAVAVALDVDTHPTIAKHLEVQAMPTMIAFRDDQEFDRIVGYKSPTDLLGWFEGIAAGKKAIEAVRERAQPEQGQHDVEARRELAHALVLDGKFQDAAKEYVWLWENMLTHRPAMVGVRTSFMASEMRELTSKSDHAREAFRALRDKTGERLKEPKVSPSDLNDWVVLNEVIADEAATLTWFDENKGDARWRSLMRQVPSHLESLLIAHERWTDLASMIVDPLREVNKEHQMLTAMRDMHKRFKSDDGFDPQELDDIVTGSFRNKIGVYYASLLAANRSVDALKVAELARQLDDAGDMLYALVATALKAKQPRAEQADWIDKHPEADARLRTLAEQVRGGLE